MRKTVSLRCEEHIRKHEKCPIDCPGRKCEYHARHPTDNNCSLSCPHRQEEIEKKKEEMQRERETSRENIPFFENTNSFSYRPSFQITPNSTFEKNPLKNMTVVGSNIFSVPPREELVPIRLDLIIDNNIPIKETFCWNLYECTTSPEEFAERFCSELDLPKRVDALVAASIRNQLQEYETILHYDMQGENIVLIKLDLIINGVSLVDQFEWDIGNPENSPEAFARSLCADLALSREFEGCIAFAIREQIFNYRKSLLLKRKVEIPGQTRPFVVEKAIHGEKELFMWTPIVGSYEERSSDPDNFGLSNFEKSPYLLLKKLKRRQEERRLKKQQIMERNAKRAKKQQARSLKNKKANLTSKTEKEETQTDTDIKKDKEHEQDSQTEEEKDLQTEEEKDLQTEEDQEENGDQQEKLNTNNQNQEEIEKKEQQDEQNEEEQEDNEKEQEPEDDQDFQTEEDQELQTEEDQEDELANQEETLNLHSQQNQKEENQPKDSRKEKKKKQV